MDLGNYIVTEQKLEDDSAIFTLTPKVPAIINECLAKGICTFTSTGKKYCLQSWYQCTTCSIYCCAVCKDKCHHGHQFTEEKTSEFFCDCGAENPRCEALSKQHK